TSHYILMTQAKYICTTHHPEHIFPSRNPYYLRRVKGLRVFLQHGVLGLKNLQKINGKQLTHFNIDLFVTSSDREKQIVNRDLLFDNNQIAVTGLPRFDRLFNEEQNVRDQILLIPTWRDWLPSQEALRKSEYLERINELLNSDILKKYSLQGTKIIFCLHPNMKQFINEFDIPEYIKAIRQDDVDVQTLIKESKLMITDYSSVGFDFSFLNKPVIYYQFDKKRFIGSQNSHIDIEAELPGYIVKNLTELNDTLEYLDYNQFEINEEIKQKSRNFLSFKDNRNCERVVETIEHFSEYSRVKDFIRYDLLSQRVFKRYRKSKYYFNSMSYLNRSLSKNAPIKKGLILFEKIVGKGVRNSTKVIYNKLIKLNKNFEIVWVTNKVYPFDDNRVKTVKRLSPMYYYYLSVAEFWINNQNFPHYIEKNKNTTYIQTWHGTPLKKMLNDVSEFKGRDETYKHRVNNAISRWDYLISPSSYASEKFRTAFNYKKEILEIGYPRNDQYFYNNETKQEQILKHLNISSDKKVILYAPTFRDDQTLSSGKHLFDLNLDLFELKEKLGKDYVFLLRPHVIVARNLKIPDSLKDFVINVSKYDDINDLMLITDILITDYSSVMFDFANTNKPMIFYTYDLEHYRDNLRGFYMNFIEEAPGPLVYNQEELINSIKNVNE